MKRFLAAGLLCAALATFTAAAPAGDYHYRRVYRPGAAYDYVLKTDSFNNGKLASQSEARSHHEVVLRDGIPFEKVTFVSLKERTDPGKGFTDLDDVARQVPPFYISLDPAGTVAVPRLIVSQMTGAVTDLVTYWVALSAKAGSSSLHQVGDTFRPAAPMHGNWAVPGSRPVGEDALAVTAQLVSQDEETVTFRTSFEPPAESALTPGYPWMAEAISADGPNNFQQVMANPDQSFNAMWGRERFVVTSTVSRADGALLEAEMTNELTLRLRVKCNAELEGCAAQLPFSIVRKQTLSLVSGR